MAGPLLCPQPPAWGRTTSQPREGVGDADSDLGQTDGEGRGQTDGEGRGAGRGAERDGSGRGRAWSRGEKPGGWGRRPAGTPFRLQRAPPAAREAPERPSEARRPGRGSSRPPPPDVYRSSRGRRGGTSCGRAGRPHISGRATPRNSAHSPLGAPRPRDHHAGGRVGRAGSAEAALRRRAGWGREGVQDLNPGPGCTSLGSPTRQWLTANSWCLYLLRFPGRSLCTRCALGGDTCLSRLLTQLNLAPLWLPAEQQMPLEALLTPRPPRVPPWHFLRPSPTLALPAPIRELLPGKLTPGLVPGPRTGLPRWSVRLWGLLPGPHLPGDPSMGGWAHLAHLS